MRPSSSSSFSSYTQLMARPQFLPPQNISQVSKLPSGSRPKNITPCYKLENSTTNKCFKTKFKHRSGFTFHYFGAHTTSYNFPTPGRKGHKSPLSLVPLWPLLIMGADLSSFGKAFSDQDFTSTYFLFFAAFVEKNEKVLFSFQSVEISKRERHFITSDLRVPEPCLNPGPGILRAIVILSLSHLGVTRARMNLKGATFPIIFVPIILR